MTSKCPFIGSVLGGLPRAWGQEEFGIFPLLLGYLEQSTQKKETCQPHRPRVRMFMALNTLFNSAELEFYPLKTG